MELEAGPLPACVPACLHASLPLKQFYAFFVAPNLLFVEPSFEEWVTCHKMTGVARFL